MNQSKLNKMFAIKQGHIIPKLKAMQELFDICSYFLNFLKSYCPKTCRIRSHNPKLQCPRWQAETIPVDHTARAKFINQYIHGMPVRTTAHLNALNAPGMKSKALFPDFS
jgi:hypothetical protein